MNASDARSENQRALLRAQKNWALVHKQLTAIAFRRIRGRSMSDAEDFAQSAIADAYRSLDKGGWDPERGPLQGYLVSRVISISGDERRRKRNTCEVWLDQEDEEDEAEALSAHEKHLADDKPAADEALHRLRFARTVHTRLLARFTGDELALQIIALMMDGLSTPRDLATATARSLDEVVEARRRIRYHADQITKELSASAGLFRAGSRSNEVSQ